MQPLYAVYGGAVNGFSFGQMEQDGNGQKTLHMVQGKCIIESRTSTTERKGGEKHEAI